MNNTTNKLKLISFDDISNNIRKKHKNEHIIQLLTKSLAKDLLGCKDDINQQSKVSLIQRLEQILKQPKASIIQRLEQKKKELQMEYINHSVTEPWQRHLTDKKLEMEIAENENKCSHNNKILQTFKTQIKEHEKSIKTLLEYDIITNHKELLKLQETIDEAKEYLKYKEEDYDFPYSDVPIL